MGKKKKETIEEGGGSFMMMFVTLSLILLAFFILLNSLAVLDAKKKRMALGSLLGSFGIMPGADSVERSVAKNSRASADLLSGEGVQKMFDAIQKEMEMILSMEDLDADAGAALFDEKTGEVLELRCTYDPATKGGDAPDGRKVKGTLHWVSAEHSRQTEIRLYDRLFLSPKPSSNGLNWSQGLVRFTSGY